jgi:purine-binding chemotaxis protein CheW
MMENARERAQYATFEVAGHYLGVPVLQVQEVLREQQLTPVPLAPPAIAGLINLRGQIIPALEMRRLLNLPERFDSNGVLSVVLHTESGPVSLQVDEIGDVVAIDPASIEAPPANLDSRIRNCLTGVCPLTEKLLLVLDTGRTVDVSAAYAHGGSE